MRLTRRDALAALSAAGVVGGGAVAVTLSDGEERTDSAEVSPEGGKTGPVDESELATLVAAAETLYPSAVEDVAGFVTRYVRGRAADSPDHASGIADAAGYLDYWTEGWYDTEFSALDPATRDEALRKIGADTATPDPAGSDVQRVRYYVVNELLFALYTTPTGGKLAGIENPQGHPGGLESYQRGPQP